MTKQKPILIGFFFTITFLSALEWPVLEIKPLRFFGQSIQNHIERGIVLDHEGIIRASDDGMVLITLEESKGMHSFPNALGNAVLLYHEDDLITIYANLSSLDRIEEKVRVDSGSIIADSVSSGWGKQNSFNFIVVDKKMKKILNPQMLLPPLKDTKLPVIKNISVISSQTKQNYALNTVKNLKQGKWQFYAEITDTIDSGPTEYAPFRVSTIINGKEVSTIAYEVLEEKGGVLMLQTAFTMASPLQREPNTIYIGEIELSRGRSDIIFIASDISGNERTLSYRLQID